jgi:Uma2 family endonuclease
MPTSATLEAKVERSGRCDDEPLYEVVDGQRVELPPMGAYQTQIASALLDHLQHFARTKRLGHAQAEMLFELAAVARERRPDVSFVSYARWPRGQRVPATAAWAVTPDLAVELVSPTNPADAVLGKVHEYFRAGVRLVWVIYPEATQIHVYRAPKRIQVLDLEDDLTGNTVLPGFRLPVKTLFEAD